MALAVGTIIEQRRTALIELWKQDPNVVVQVESPDVLPVLTFLDDRGRNAGVGPSGLNVAYRVAGAEEFALTQVDGSVDVSGISLAAANDGTLHLVYLDESNLLLKHARLVP